MLGTNETFQDDAPLAEFWYEAIVWLRALSQRSLHGCLTHHLRWLRDRELCWRHCAYLDIREYLGQLVDRNLANATLTLYRWSIGKLYHWAHREGHRADNPMTCLAPMKRRERNLRWVPSLQHVERLLHEPNVNTALGVRDRCILELLYATGLRASELLGVQSWQISPRSRCIKIRGKGERERLVIYGEVATEWLEQYIHEARPYLLRQTGLGEEYTQPVRTADAQPVDELHDAVAHGAQSRAARRATADDAARASARLRHPLQGRRHGSGHTANAAGPRQPEHHHHLRAHRDGPTARAARTSPPEGAVVPTFSAAQQALGQSMI